jgi:hypothetical protein
VRFETTKQRLIESRPSLARKGLAAVCQCRLGGDSWQGWCRLLSIDTIVRLVPPLRTAQAQAVSTGGKMGLVRA